MPQHPPAGEVVISMRTVSVFANAPDSEIEQLQAALRGRWRQAARAMMVLLSAHGRADAGAITAPGMRRIEAGLRAALGMAE